MRFRDNAQLRQQIEDELRALSQYTVIVDEQRWRECYISSDGLYTVAVNILHVMDAYSDKRAEEGTRRFPRRGANAGTGGRVRMPIPGKPIPVNVQVGSPVPPAQSKGKR